jgi:regulator of sigma E protease
MRVERFSLFFPPTLASVRRGETEYAIGAIPAGGYVKITGMTPEELRAPDSRGLGTPPSSEDEPPLPVADLRIGQRAYYTQPPWKRAVVILAGPAMNLLVAFVLFWGLLLAGSTGGAVTLGDLAPSVRTLDPTTQVAGLEQSHPAARVLRIGDLIVAVDGQRASVAGIARAVGRHACAGAPVAGCVGTTAVKLTVRRAGGLVDVSVHPRYNAKDRRMEIGFFFGATAKSFGVLGAARTALASMWNITTETVANIGHAFTSSKVRGQLHSIVGITEITQQAVAYGIGYALVILGFVSLVLAVINLFPFLPLDGGHVLWSVVEKVRGRRVSLATMWRFSSVGILLLAFLVINGFSNDISHLGGS